MQRGTLRIARRVSALLALAALAGCAAVYPELATRTRPIAAGVPLDPAPPSDVRWVKFTSATVPERTRDGRTWQRSGKGADPYAKLLINGKEVLKTPVQSNTFTPTWPDGPKGNIKIGADDKLRIELWDSNALNDAPIGMKEIGRPTEEQVLEKRLRVEFDGGGELLMAYEPAHALQGLGLWYELKTEGCNITRMLEGSPAERAGLQPNDEVLEIAGRKVKIMTADEVKSAFNAVPFDGIALMLKHPDGTTLNVKLKEGPIYPIFSQFGPVE